MPLSSLGYRERERERGNFQLLMIPSSISSIIITRGESGAKFKRDAFGRGGRNFSSGELLQDRLVECDLELSAFHVV